MRSAQKWTTPGNNAIARFSIIVIVSSDNLSCPKKATFIQSSIVIDTHFSPRTSLIVDMTGRPYVTFKSFDGRRQ
jgi:hypothetical protein